MSSVNIARFILSFSWFYHGLFPKLIHVAPVERLMTASLGLSDKVSYLMTKSAGIAEVIFAVVIFIFYQSRLIILINIVALIALLLFVVLLQPQLLIAAFNPVTTNIALIGFSLILLNEITKTKNRCAVVTRKQSD